MNVSFKGFNEKVLTFKCEEEITKGYGVKITDNHTVGMCDEGDAFTGFCLDSDNENAVIQVSGYVKMNYSDASPALGKNALVCTVSGTVKENANGTPCTVLTVNESDSTVEFLF